MTAQADTQPSAVASRVFVGTAGALMVLLFWATLQFWGLGKAPFHTKGEPREALLVWEMTEGNGWILPSRNGTELPSKPPFFHWLAAAASLAHGQVDEWSVRLPSAVLSGAGVLLIYITGLAIWNTRAALMGALALLSSFEWQRAATSARVDMTLTFGLTVSLTGLLLFRFRGRGVYAIAFYAGMLWGVLAKGPIGIALPLVVLVTLALVDPGIRPLHRLRPVAGFTAVVLLAGLWYLLAFWKGGQSFFVKQILLENIMRVAGGHEYGLGHEHSAAYLCGALLAGLLPWSLFLPPALGTAARDWKRLHPSRPFFLPLLWIAVVFAVFAAATSKRGVYLLGLYPPLFLLLGCWWDAILRAPERAPGPRFSFALAGLAWALSLGLSVVCLALAAALAGVPLFPAIAGHLEGEAAAQAHALGALVDARGPIVAVLVGAASVAAGAVALAARVGRWGQVFTGLLVSVAALTVTVQDFVLPAIAQQKTRRTFADSIRHIVPESDRVLSYAAFDYGLTYYWGGRLPVYRGALSPSGPPHLVIAEQAWEAIPTAQRTGYERVAMLESGRAGNLGRMILVTRHIARAEPVTNESPSRFPPPSTSEEGES